MRKVLKRRTEALLAVTFLAMALLLSACGGGGGGSDTPVVKPATLTFNPATLSVNVTEGNNPLDQTVTLANASNLSVPWTATSDAAWLTMNPTSGTLAANGQATLPVLKFATSSLAAGSYTGTITIFSTTAAVTGVTIPVALTVKPAAVAAKTKNVFIGGTAGIGQLSSLVASAGVHKAVAAAPTASTVLTNAKVTITVTKADGSSATTLSKTNDQGAYSAEVSAAEGDTITVKISKDGFTSLNKTIKVTSNENNQYTVSGNVAKAAVQVVKASGGVFKASGGTGPGFRFGLTRHASGALVPFAGSDEVVAAAAAGAEPELDISIPASWAPDATALTTQLAAFDPSKPAERQMFPGEFVGVGGGSAGAAKADAAEYALESVSFFQADVTPNNGQPLSPTVATGASKAAAEATVIYKYIPTDGCTAMQKYADRDADATNGVQMPIYSYNSGSGKWVYIGEGTLKTYDSSTGGYVTVAATDVVSHSTGLLDNLACTNTSDYFETSYYFEIAANEWYTWWNLDYPLLFAQPEITKIVGTVVDQYSKPISGAYVEADGYSGTANSYAYAYADTEGNFSLNLTTDTDAGKTAAGYVFTAYDYSTWPAQSTEFTSQLPGTIDPTKDNDVGNVIITDTLTCSVNGKILQEAGTGTNPAPEWTWVDLYSKDYTFYNWVYTDASGNFTSKVPCFKLINLETWQKSLVFNADTIKSGTEKSDDGTTVTIADIILTNNAPDVYAWISPNPGKVGQAISLSSSAWDYEGNYPLTYAWTISNASGSPVATSSLDVFNWTPADEGNYSAQLVVTDDLDNATTLNETLSVNPNTNTPPVIYGSWAEASQTCDGMPILYVDAYDPDGDELSYSFSEGTPIFDSTSGGWVPATDLTSSTVTVTVSDNGTPSKNASVNIYVPQSSGLELYYAEGWPLIQSVEAPVELYAYADDFGSPNTTYTWAITGPDNSAAFISYGGDNSYGYFSASLPGTYDVTLTVTGGLCGETITRSFSVNVIPPGSVNVILQ